MNRLCRFITQFSILVIFTTFTVVEGRAQQINESMLSTMEWRAIGPSRGGRATAATGVPGKPLLYYVGPTGGGIWKTENAGISWQPIADGQIGTGSVGAIAVAPSDHNVIYIGMGERDPRGNFSHGDGVYKSTDAGRTWKHIGLADTRQIGKIRIHPTNPEHVYVAALGHVFGPNEERGVFRSTDGGETWEKILYVDQDTGAVELEMDPTNPRILFAGFWQVRRTPWGMDSGGPGSGIYRSKDGGDTWEELTEGLPEGIKGKIGIAVSQIDPLRIFALVEASDGGVYRSNDGGDTWSLINSDPNLRQRAWYYTHIYADTQDIDTVYVMNVSFLKSTDGGKNFDQRIRVPHGDNHHLWINPDNNMNMINANDGGANISFDGGKSWSKQDMQPTAQFYHVTVDNQFPYRVYGAQQDNSTISISSQNRIGRWQSDSFSVGGGESGYIAVNPDDPNIIYAGSYGGYLTRYDHRTRISQNVTVWPDNPMGAGVEAMKYRFQWTFPIFISPHDSNTVYTGGNVLFKSTNGGHSWEAISPDLTTNDKSKQVSSGGPITKDNTAVEYYCTIFAAVESPHEQGVIWIGSDDGLVHITRDGGESWQEVTPAGLGKWSLISQIDVSPHDPATCYLAVNRYKMDDFMPYIFKTNDYGKTWEKITNGINDGAFVRAVREDNTRRGLLYAGTETGMWISFDDGKNWQSLQLNLPATPITDLVVKDDDLVIATQGRSFWILDDLSPLREMSEEVAASNVHLFKPRETYKARGFDVRVHFNITNAKDDDVTLEFLTEDGELIKKYVGELKEGELEDEDDEEEEVETVEVVEITEIAADVTEEESQVAEKEVAEEDAVEAEGKSDDEEEDEDDPAIGRLQVAKGMNLFHWNMRYPDAAEVPNAVMWGGGTSGPPAAPGNYQVRLTVGEWTQTQPVIITPDPRFETSAEDYKTQFDFVWVVRNKVDEIHRAINEIRSIRSQMNSVVKRSESHEAGEEIEEAAKAIDKVITEIEEALIQTKSKSSQDPLNYPIRLNDKISGLSYIASGNWKPTEQVQAVFAELAAQADQQIARLKEVISTDIPALNQLVHEKNVPAIIVEEDEGE